MPLESLLELVETLRGRIDDHGAALRQNEMRTRYALIDPLLQELGWDTSDPSEVMIEDGSGDGRADYLLLDNDQPVMIIEAKRLGLGVSDGRQQAVNYAMDPGRRARYFGVTDGNEWEIYDTHQPAINMLIVSFTLREDTPAEVCLHALALWRPAVEQGSVMPAQAPIIGLGATERNTTEPVTGPGIQKTPSATIQTDVADREWVPLSELKPKLGSSPPVEIQFPDNSRAMLGRWNLMIIEIVRWLMENNLLDHGVLPIQQGRRYLVAESPVHSTGTRFHQPKQVGPLYLEVSYNADRQAINTHKVVSLAGQDPAQFKVRLSS